jgi:membrane protein implicated in regulation of membrane protease activity
MKNNKKGGATVYLVILGILVLAIAAIFIRLNWRRFKAEASFGFAVAGTVIAVLLILFLMIRHSIRKAKKEKAKEQARLEKERLEQERIAAGGKPSTLGDGKLEMNDVSEVAGKAMDRIDKFLEGGE